MGIVFAVFGIMFGCFYSFTLFNRNKEIVENLDRIEHSFIEGKTPTTLDFFIAEINEEGLVGVIAKSEKFPDSAILEIANNCSVHGYQIGSLDNYYYKISNVNRSVVIAMDMSHTLKTYSKANNLVLIIELCAFLLTFGIVLMLSKNVFEPIKATLDNHKKFLSDASHELKTPIAVISANADVIKSSDDSEWINNIKTQTERMSLLVKDLLTLSAIDEKINVKTKDNFSLSDEIIKVTLFFDALAFENGKRIITDVDTGINYVGDANSVRKITEILVENAIKYATKNTDIIVSLKPSGKKHVLTVYNEGSNVPKEDANKIFERFYRADNSRSRTSGGSGLGLSIAKSLCELNKWKISVNCEYKGFMQIKVTF